MKLKQKLFCEYYVGECRGNAEQSAIKAGYSRNCARSTGYKLLQKAEIKQYIAEKSTEIATENIATQQEVQEFWSSVLRDEDEAVKNRLRASELLAKVKGMFNNDW